MYSYDKAIKKLVLRQFHVENIPAGWKAKESYRIVSADEFIETFSLAEPGKDFTVYSEARLQLEPEYLFRQVPAARPGELACERDVPVERGEHEE